MLFLIPTYYLTLPSVCDSHTFILSLHESRQPKANTQMSLWYHRLHGLLYSFSCSLFYLLLSFFGVLHCDNIAFQSFKFSNAFKCFMIKSALKPRKIKRLAQGHLVCDRFSLAWVSELRIELPFYWSMMLSLSALCTHLHGNFCQKSY